MNSRPYLNRHGCLVITYSGRCFVFGPDTADLPGAYPVLLDAVAHIIGFRDPGTGTYVRKRGTFPLGAKASDYYDEARQALYRLGVLEGADGRIGFADVLPRRD